MQVFLFSWKYHEHLDPTNPNNNNNTNSPKLRRDNSNVFFQIALKEYILFSGKLSSGPKYRQLSYTTWRWTQLTTLELILSLWEAEKSKYNSQSCPEKMITLNNFTTREQASKKTLLPFRQVGRTDQTLSFSSTLQVIIGQKSRKSVGNSNH